MFLGIFYGNLKRDHRIFPDEIDYQDIITGEKLHTSIKELFSRSDDYAERLIVAAYDYYLGKLTREQASLVIRGESLDTGKVNIPVSMTKYYHK